MAASGMCEYASNGCLVVCLPAVYSYLLSSFVQCIQTCNTISSPPLYVMILALYSDIKIYSPHHPSHISLSPPSTSHHHSHTIHSPIWAVLHHRSFFLPYVSVVLIPVLMENLERYPFFRVSYIIIEVVMSAIV